MLQIIENFLTSIFHNLPDNTMKGGGTKIIIRNKKVPKKIIKINLFANKEVDKPIAEPIVESESEPEVSVKEEPIAKKQSHQILGEPNNLTLGEIYENLDRFNKLGHRKLQVLDKIVIEALDRRKLKLSERKDEVEDLNDMEVIDLEIEYINMIKTKKYPEEI